MKMRMMKKKSVDTDVLTLARQRINHIYDNFDHVAVSFSGGKDSTVVFNLALEVARERNRLPLRVIHFDEEAIPHDVEDYLRRMSKLDGVEIEWYCIPVKHRNACHPEHPFWYPWAPEARELWVRDMPPEGITHLDGYDSDNVEERLPIPELNALLFKPELGRSCVMLGIRADESLTRQRAVSRRIDENYIIKNNRGYSHEGTQKFKHASLHKAYPIYDWSTADVWTAPNKFGWDYCRYYDLLEMIGVSHHQQRLAPPYGEESFKRLADYAKTYPELWAKMVLRVPGANTAALYSSTVLYGFGEVPEKPKDVDWMDFILSTLSKHTPDLQRQIKARLHSEMRRHFRKAPNDPILDSVGHYITGLSWNFMLMIAVRGDVKNRKIATTNAAPKALYDAARKALELELSDSGTRY